MLCGFITLFWHKLNKAHLLQCYTKTVMESYKNNCSLVLQIATKDRYIQRQIKSQTSSVSLHGQFVWRYLMTSCPALILSPLTHSCSRKCIYTRHSKCNQSGFMSSAPKTKHTENLRGNKVHDLNRAVVHNTHHIYS